MSFQSFSFLAFLAMTVVASRLAGHKSAAAGKLCLSLASIVFYVVGANAAGLVVLAAGTGVTVLAVNYLLEEREAGVRKRALWLACIWHIAVLLVFKYTGFFTGGVVTVGWSPLGLSFFTFQQLWLLKEVYTREFVPEDRWELVLHALFFPSVTSGPILRPGSFFHQLRGEKFLRSDAQDMAAGLYAICCGTVKKVLLADPLGGIANNGWNALGDLGAVDAWMVILAYTLQLYLDFSGYCDIAAGCARLLGLRLPVNFDSPYRALSVTEFWKRWHITLTTFLRECLYFPLGGSKKGAVRAYLNILIVFLVSGFWHGAGWTFIVWGALHGLGQIVERLLGNRRNVLPKVLQWVLTFTFVNIAWVFFRAPDFASAMELLCAAVTGGLAVPQAWLVRGILSKEVGAIQLLWPALKPWTGRIITVVLFGGGLLASLMPGNTIRKMDSFRPAVWQAAALCLLTVWAVLSFSGVATFIYSNF